MPVARIQTPDGRVITVEVPEGATQEQILQFVQSQQPQLTDRQKALKEAGDISHPFGDADPGAVEDFAKTILSGAVATPIAGVAGVLTAINPLTDASGADVVRSVQKALTFEPKEKESKEAIARAGERIKTAANFPVSGLGGIITSVKEGDLEAGAETVRDVQKRGFGKVAGEKTLDVTGSPALASLVETSPAALEIFLGIKGANTSRGGSKVKGISDDAAFVLEREGINIDNLSPQNVKKMQDAVEQDFAAQVKRRSFLEQQGIQPTKAEVTQRPSDFIEQQDLAKGTSGVSARQQQTQSRLLDQFDDIVTEGTPNVRARPLQDQVTSKATVLDDEISRLYKVAGERAKGQDLVQVQPFVRSLRNSMGDSRITKGLPDSIKGDLVNKGIIDNDFNVLRKITVDESEGIRQLINTNFTSTTPKGKNLIRNLKESLDNSTFKSIGEDLFKDSRRAVVDFNKELSRAKISKFDTSKKNLVRDILDNKLAEGGKSSLTQKVIRGDNWNASDINQLKTYLTTGKRKISGQKAWQQFRKDTLEDIRDNAFRGKDGELTVTRARLEATIKRIGIKKLRAILEPDEMKFINDMVRTTRIIEPSKGTVLGSGPSGKAIQSLLNKIPFGLGEMFKGLKTSRANRLALDPSPLSSNIRSQFGDLPGVATAAVIDEILEEAKQ